MKTMVRRDLLRAPLAVWAAARAAEAPVSLPGLLTGSLDGLRVVTPAPSAPGPVMPHPPGGDIDLQRMAAWAMNYLIRTPRPELDYEPVFQCHPYACPPIPAGTDPVVACDTDARMDWEWYYMREISGSAAGREVEAAFHRRMRRYIAADGKVWSHPGAYNESLTQQRYTRADSVVHVWGATKILHSLSEDYARTGDPSSRKLARKVMLGLKSLASSDASGRLWFEGGMGAWRDGRWIPNGWNRQPAPIVEPLVRYWQATRDEEGLSFARGYAEGMVHNSQPNGIRFQPDGRFDGHSHATMHAVWGVGELGLVMGETGYVRFAERCWNYLLGRGTGTGWFPAGPDDCDETCCLADMVSVAALLGRAGETRYYDAVERYLRNYIAPLQFVIDPEFEEFYRRRNRDRGDVDAGLAALKRFQGGIIGGSGLNDYENVLLGGASGFEMFGCCAPEGMRAIYTAWANTIEKRSDGIYVNLGFGRESPWGTVYSFFPESGRITVVAQEQADFHLRPPSWTPAGSVEAWRNGIPVKTATRAGYVLFSNVRKGEELTITFPLIGFRHSVSGLWSKAKDLTMRYEWLGNMVIRADPSARRFPLFRATPRLLPSPPA